MVSSRRIDGNLPIKRIFDPLCDVDSILGHFFRRLSPNGVWRVVPSPEKEVGFSIFYVVQHAFESFHWQVTLV